MTPSHVTEYVLENCPDEVIDSLTQLPDHIISLVLINIQFSVSSLIAGSVQCAKLQTLKLDHCSASLLLKGSHFPNLTKIIYRKCPQLTFEEEFSALKEISCAHAMTFPRSPVLRVINAEQNKEVMDWSVLFKPNGEFIDKDNYGLDFLSDEAMYHQNSAATVKLYELFLNGEFKNLEMAASTIKMLIAFSNKGDPIASLKLGELCWAGKFGELVPGQPDKEASWKLIDPFDSARVVKANEYFDKAINQMETPVTFSDVLRTYIGTRVQLFKGLFDGMMERYKVLQPYARY